MRRKFTTSLDEDLILELRICALKEKMNINEMLEDFIKQFLDGKIALTKKEERGQILE